jgi:adenosylcobinamide kinase/adenosylcobinamide-phosphate guanylyltransferase
MTLILLTGGARSGKSAFAERLARTLGGDDVVYLATAEPLDEEMAVRIARHRADRPVSWRTLESPRTPAATLRAQPTARTVILDCLTLLVSNLLLASGPEPDEDAVRPVVEAELHALADWASGPSRTLIIVTNEVGLGIVPEMKLARIYRDLLGRANQLLAARAAEVYLLFSGIPVELKRLASGPGGTCS